MLLTRIEGSRRCAEQEVREGCGCPGGEPWAGGHGEVGDAGRPPAC